jgi:hypothetical protein
MKALWTTVCVLSIAGAASAAFISVTDAPSKGVVMNNAVTEGVIDSVADDHASFTLRTAEDSVTIKVTDETAYTLNGEASTMGEAVKAGRDAKVTHENMTASKVDVTTEA